jgi:hypothetical protein
MILLLEILQLSKIDQNSQDLRKCQQSEKSDRENNITKISHHLHIPRLEGSSPPVWNRI